MASGKGGTFASNAHSCHHLSCNLASKMESFSCKSSCHRSWFRSHQEAHAFASAASSKSFQKVGDSSPTRSSTPKLMSLFSFLDLLEVASCRFVRFNFLEIVSGFGRICSRQEDRKICELFHGINLVAFFWLTSEKQFWNWAFILDWQLVPSLQEF